MTRLNFIFSTEFCGKIRIPGPALRNSENLNADRREHERLEEALSLNRPLATAYYLKDEYFELKILAIHQTEYALVG
jgi:hypothetical protein